MDFSPLAALPGKSLSPLGVFGHQDPLSKAINGLFGSTPAPFKVNKQTGMYEVNGAKGGKKFLGGSFDPRTGAFTINNPKNRDFSSQQAAIDAYLAGTGPRPEGKQFSRLLKAIDASGYLTNPAGGAAQQNAAAPWSTQAFAPMMPALLNQQAAFARPEAAQFLAAMTGQQAPAWAGGPAQAGGAFGPAPANPFLAAGIKAGAPPMPAGPIKPDLGTMYAGGTPGFYAGGQNTSPGPAPNPFLGLNRLAGPFGNGGGPIAPVPGMNT